MRLRTLVVILIAGALLGTGIWLYGNSAQTMGAGGLPLIKADSNPVKLPPEEPGGEMMANAESTVFSAMGETADQSDPSMEGLKLPALEEETTVPESTEFAGLRTGFAVPAEPERKTESLFGETHSKYLSGMVDNPSEKKETVEEPVIEEIKTEPVQEPVVAPKPEPKEPEVKKAEAPKEEPALPPPPADEPLQEDLALPPSDGIVAQSLEAQEKILIRPVSKPPVPLTQSVSETTNVEPKTKTIETVEAPVMEAAPKPEDAPYSPPKREVPPIPVEQPVAPAPTTSSGAAYYIQLASVPAEGTAGADTWKRLQKKYPDALAGVTPDYVSAQVPGKGEYVRIQSGPFTQAQAKERCEAIKLVDSKGGCLVLKR